MKLFFIVISAAVMLSSCTSREKSFIGNPASQKCINAGGKVITIQGQGGESAVCIFSDNSVCDEWKFFRKQCQPGACMLLCKESGSENEGWYDCNNLLIVREKCSSK